MNEGAKRSIKFTKFRVCCNVNGQSHHAHLQLTTDVENLHEGAQIQIRNVNFSKKFGTETLAANKKTQIVKLEDNQNQSVGGNRDLWKNKNFVKMKAFSLIFQIFYY